MWFIRSKFLKENLSLNRRALAYVLGLYYPKGEVVLRSSRFTPYLSFIGFGLVILTLSVNVSFKLGIEKGLDEGSLMLLSVANAVLLIYTLVWGVFGVIEFMLLWKEKQKMKSKLERGKMNKEEFWDQTKRVKTSLGINISYIVILLFQIGYVIINWDEVDV